MSPLRHSPSCLKRVQEPAMIYATANTDHYIPIRNLSTTHKHYTTDKDLCSTIEDTYRTYCNLSTAIDPYYSEPPTVLARQPYIPFDHTTTVGLPHSLTRHMIIFPPTIAEPFDPTIIFGRPISDLM
jgi:hypothetical protein